MRACVCFVCTMELTEEEAARLLDPSPVAAERMGLGRRPHSRKLQRAG